jgi:hypothetical protein
MAITYRNKKNKIIENYIMVYKSKNFVLNDKLMCVILPIMRVVINSFQLMLLIIQILWYIMSHNINISYNLHKTYNIKSSYNFILLFT